MRIRSLALLACLAGLITASAPAAGPAPAPTGAAKPATQPARSATQPSPTAAAMGAAKSPATRPASPPAPDYSGPALRAMAETIRGGDDPDVVSASGIALASLGAQAIPALQLLQSDPNPQIRARAVQIASAMSDPGAAVPLMIRALRDSDLEIRRIALHYLDGAKVRDATAVAAAAELLADRDADVQAEAANYLTDLGEDAAPAVPRLVKTLDSRTIHLLAGIGPAAKAATPALVSFYQNKSNPRQDRIDAIAALARILAPPGPAPAPQPATALASH